MRLPVIQGVIRRRILVNFRVAPDVMQAQLPARFAPKLQGDHAIAGVCLIRLEGMRPRLVPPFAGMTSENAAHRVAVTWKTGTDEPREGVFIPRRDTSSVVNRLAGGRLFPSEHHPATFMVHDRPEALDFHMRSRDGTVEIRLRGRPAHGLAGTSCFPSLEAASRFFEPGSLGYSVTRDPGRLDGVAPRTHGWRVEPLEIDEIHSSYFADTARFPPGSVEFDCALIMRNLAHEWHSAEDLYL